MAFRERSAIGMFAVRAARIGVVALVCTGGWRASAHEGHGGVAPILRELSVGAERWRIGLGVVPPDPVAGEALHIEIKANPVGADGVPSEKPVASDRIRLVVDGTSVALRTAETPGVLVATHTVDSAGPYQLVVEVRSGDLTRREAFPVTVRPGPAQRLRPFVIVALVLLSGMGTGVLWRRWRPSARLPVGWIAAAATASVAIVVLASMTVTPILARRFMPERQPLVVDWVTDTRTVIAGSAAPPEVTGTAWLPSAATGFEAAVVVAGRVVPPPDRVAEVRVPFPGRILPLESDQVSVGRYVTKGQKLAILQPTYIMHDALHLINQRWPILASTIESKWRMLETEATAARLNLALADKAVSLSELQAAEAAASAAKQEYERWSRTLAMHDVQIQDNQKSRIELKTPISGEVAAANFTQGQLVYEGSPLFTVVDLGTVWIEAKVPERLVSRFRGAAPEFLTPAYLPMTFRGRLQRIAPQVDAETRTLSHFYLVDNSQKRLRLGMLVSVRLPAPGGSVAKTVMTNVGVSTFGTPPTAPAQRRSVLGEVRAKPERTAQVVSPIWGRMEFADKPLAVGDVVRKGQSLVRLILELNADERYLMEARKVELQSALGIARTRKTQSELAYKRSITLMKADPRSKLRQQQVVSAETQFKTAGEDQDLLERQVRAFDAVIARRDPRVTLVEAPIAGVITELDVAPGQLNPTGEFRKLCTIVDLSRVWVEANIYERDIGDILHGTQAFYALSESGDLHPLGRPVAVLPWIDEKTRTATVLYELPNPGGQLRLGMTVQIVYETTGQTNQ